MNTFPHDSYTGFVALAYQRPPTASLKYTEASSCLADRPGLGSQQTSVLAGALGRRSSHSRGSSSTRPSLLQLKGSREPLKRRWSCKGLKQRHGELCREARLLSHQMMHYDGLERER